MNLQNSEQRHKMVLLAGLYITQFLGLGFIITAVPTIMRENGASLDDIAWIYMLGLIWAIKFMWAPLIDRYGSKRYGHYRSWLIVLQSAIILSLIAAAFFDINHQLPILAVFFSLISIFSATQDIAADALAVTILKPEERGIGNSIQMAGGFIGNLIGGGVVLIAYEWLGWTASLLILAAGTAIPLVNILLHQEQPAPTNLREEKVSYKEIIRFFKRPRIKRWVLLLSMYSLGFSMAYALLNPMLVDLGWSLDEIGFATNIIGSLIAIVGAAVAGWLVQSVGRKPAMLLIGILVILAVMGLYIPAQGTNNIAIIYGSIGLMLLTYGANVTILATMMMDKTDLTAPGTDYTLQYSLFSFLSFVVSGLALTFAESLGYSGVLTIAVGASLFSLLLVWGYQDFDPISEADYNLAPTHNMPVMAEGQSNA